MRDPDYQKIAATRRRLQRIPRCRLTPDEDRADEALMLSQLSIDHRMGLRPC